mmetsp:Transcript_5130/g.7562  ORF Transcript_5130/g.7562 Transcript_5130/m.7562 type:complete len:148 (-) Transcript_5130:347-790(-)
MRLNEIFLGIMLMRCISDAGAELLQNAQVETSTLYALSSPPNSVLYNENDGLVYSTWEDSFIRRSELDGTNLEVYSGTGTAACQDGPLSSALWTSSGDMEIDTSSGSPIMYLAGGQYNGINSYSIRMINMSSGTVRPWQATAITWET